MNKILVDRPLHDEAFKKLTAEAEAVEIYDDDRTKLEAALKTVDGVICSAALKMMEPEIAMGSNIKVIGRPGVGYDSVDVGAAGRYGIPLVYTPDGPTESVAEHVAMMMLMAAKKVNIVQKAIKEDKNFSIRTKVTGIELQGKTLGLIGFGRIGRRTAEIAALGLGMKIIVFDPYMKDGPETGYPYRQASAMEELLGSSDVVSLHIPYSPDTAGMFGASEFAAMKNGAVFINTARGGVVDEPALIQALKDGQIGAAGLDVFTREPPEKDNELLTFENVIATPHLSSFTDDGKRKMGVMVVEGVLDVLAGREPEFMVNREIWEKRRR